MSEKSLLGSVSGKRENLPMTLRSLLGKGIVHEKRLQSLVVVLKVETPEEGANKIPERNGDGLHRGRGRRETWVPLTGTGEAGNRTRMWGELKSGCRRWTESNARTKLPNRHSSLIIRISERA